MKIFVLKNTNSYIAYECCKAFKSLSKKQKEFSVIFDKVYEFVYHVPELVGKIHSSEDHNISKMFFNNETVLIDFSIDWFLCNENPIQYAKNKILGEDYITDTINISVNDTVIQKINNKLQESNVHNYSFVYLGDINKNLYSKLKDYLSERVNVVEKIDGCTDLELYQLIKSCDCAIVPTGIEQSIADDLGKTNFVVVEQANPYIANNNSYVFDPFKNDFYKTIPNYFSTDSKHTLQANNQFLSDPKILDLLIKELFDCFDNIELPYVNFDETNIAIDLPKT